MLGAVNQPARKWQAPEHSIPQNNACQNLAHDFRLPDFYEHPAQKLSEANQREEEDKDLGQFGVRHGFLLRQLDAAVSEFVCSRFFTCIRGRVATVLAKSVAEGPTTGKLITGSSANTAKFNFAVGFRRQPKSAKIETS
jgi:hypothetical protein